MPSQIESGERATRSGVSKGNAFCLCPAPVYNSFSEAAAGFTKAVLLSPNPLYRAVCFASEKNKFPFT